MRYSAFLCLFIIWFSGLSQSLPVGFPVLEEQLRRKQLIGTFDSLVSFAIRPVKTADSIYSMYRLPREELGGVSLTVLPFHISAEYATQHPYGINNGAMLPNRGYQGILSPGFHLSTRFFEAQIKPEILLAQNKSFEGFPLDGSDRRWSVLYFWWNRSDVPQRFSTTPNRKIFMGQSYLRFRYDFLSLGVSTENLWWGPGKFNSLILTNNAAGFRHISLATTRPIQSPVGSFEGQLIAGNLKNSGYYPPDTARRYTNTPVYFPKHDDSRYLSGISLSYQPKWISGLFLGVNHVIQQYAGTAAERSDYLPVITNLFRFSPEYDARSLHDRLSSVYLRWVMPNSEIYFEYGRNNSSWKIRDLLQSLDDDAAFVFGLSKLFPLQRADSYLELEIEVTQLQQTPAYTVRSGGKSWYTHHHVRHGYTHSGEFLGAGIGSGSNMQVFGFSWIRNLKKVGIQLERWTHNNDFYYFYFEHNRDYRSYWVDYVVGAEASWDLGKLLVSGRINYIYSLNYQWETDADPETGFFESGVDATNMFFSLDLAYRLGTGL